MSREVARPALYRGTINLGVEDALSRGYLSALWESPPDLFFLITGGNEGVNAVVKDAEAAGFPNVFGLIGRDFRPTNRSHGNSPGSTATSEVGPVTVPSCADTNRPRLSSISISRKTSPPGSRPMTASLRISPTCSPP
jgi:hypothetical protein